MSNFHQLRLRQLDASLTRWRDASLPSRPASGWVKAIRQALGMSSAALAQHLGVTGSAVRKLEASESSDAITLGTLRRAATALDCELQYALVPREKLASKLEARALKVAQQRVDTVAKSMALEGQAVDIALSKSQTVELARVLLANNPRQLW